MLSSAGSAGLARCGASASTSGRPPLLPAPSAAAAAAATTRAPAATPPHQPQQQLQRQQQPSCSMAAVLRRPPGRRRVGAQAVTSATSDAASTSSSNSSSATAAANDGDARQRSGASASTSAATAAADDRGGSSGSSSLLDGDAAQLRRVASASTAADALELLIAAADARGLPHAVSPADAELLLEASLAAGNPGLALSVYQQLCAARRAASGGALRPAAAAAAAAPWPPATLQHTCTLVTGLCRQLRVGDALAVLASVRSSSHGAGGSSSGSTSSGSAFAADAASDEAVSFGVVVSSPLPPGRPLAVVQPQEGAKLVADAESRYEFELFSGAVRACSSQALQPGSNPAAAALRAVGLWRRRPVAAVHELVVAAPDGASRTFRVGTASADVPAAVGERVTVVCAPSAGANRQRRLLLTTSPPDTAPGQALLIANHRTGVELPLLRPPLPGAQTNLPGWLLPAAVLLAGGDAASALLDPALPLLIAGGLAATVGGAVAGSTVVLPALKKLPASAVKLEGVRQELLAQHARLEARVKQTAGEAADDVRTLARLWQLRAKMSSVTAGATAGGATGGGTANSSLDGGGGGSSSGVGSGGGVVSLSSGSYEARIERVAAAAGGIERRLAKRLELLDGYARVMSMIEIEVEMDMQVPLAELQGIDLEMSRLAELESIREEWAAQAEAQDEVERLLRASPS